MSNEQIIKDIQEVIVGFQTQMYEWEANAYRKLNNEGASISSSTFQETEKAIIRTIYDKYLTQKQRKFGKLVIGVSVCYPPTFNPDIETIKNIEIEGDTAIVITTLMKGKNEHQRQYFLKLSQNIWKIDNIKYFSNYDLEWYSMTL